MPQFYGIMERPTSLRVANISGTISLLIRSIQAILLLLPETGQDYGQITLMPE
jgi:hypothetical protein